MSSIFEINIWNGVMFRPVFYNYYNIFIKIVASSLRFIVTVNYFYFPSM